MADLTQVSIRILDSPALNRMLENFGAGVTTLAMLYTNLEAPIPPSRTEVRAELLRAIGQFNKGLGTAARSRRRAKA